VGKLVGLLNTPACKPTSILTSYSLLGLDALYDPPRLMTSQSSLDMPSATANPSAEPQQGASTKDTLATPTAASQTLDGADETINPSDAIVKPSESHNNPSPDPESSNTHTAFMETQTPHLTTPGDPVTRAQSGGSSDVGSSVASGTSPGDEQRGSDEPTATQASLAVIGICPTAAVYIIMLLCLFFGYLAR